MSAEQRDLADVLSTSLVAGGPLHSRAVAAERLLSDLTDAAMVKLAKAEDAGDEVQVQAWLDRARADAYRVAATARRFTRAALSIAYAIAKKRGAM